MKAGVGCHILCFFVCLCVLNWMLWIKNFLEKKSLFFHLSPHEHWQPSLTVSSGYQKYSTLFILQKKKNQIPVKEYIFFWLHPLHVQGGKGVLWWFVLINISFGQCVFFFSLSCSRTQVSLVELWHKWVRYLVFFLFNGHGIGDVKGVLRKYWTFFESEERYARFFIIISC